MDRLIFFFLIERESVSESQRRDCLHLQLAGRREEQPLERQDNARLHHKMGVLGRAGQQVGDGPARLMLQSNAFYLEVKRGAGRTMHLELRMGR